MNDAKYIGLDVHQATISVAILDSTKTATILQFATTHAILPVSWYEMLMGSYPLILAAMIRLRRDP